MHTQAGKPQKRTPERSETCGRWERAERRAMGVLLRPGRGAAVAQVTRLAWCPQRAAQRHTCPLSLHVLQRRDTPRQCQQGTLGSRPSFLGDCCQVRNSKAEFLILVENGRCSSLGLLLDPELALRWAGHPADSSDCGDSRVPEDRLCPGCWGCTASGIAAWRAARGVGLFLPFGEQQAREGGDTAGTTEKCGGTRAALSRLHRLPSHRVPGLSNLAGSTCLGSQLASTSGCLCSHHGTQGAGRAPAQHWALHGHQCQEPHLLCHIRPTSGPSQPPVGCPWLWGRAALPPGTSALGDSPCCCTPGSWWRGVVQVGGEPRYSGHAEGW
ncbi:uncharacterized protein LOC110403259 isoform X2 [Numida meleagris]|uniref:uncharacterized protein LOC110403259 isoform X2 n=1 Tax=Numida meleagris TaxID=8996 RepID=UPI000B3D90FA|nr:uncharacterized protein LOC110403259 isoform X2 [Numida meleagris]